MSGEIKGYRVLTGAEIDSINALKDLGAALGAMIDKLEKTADIDKRWLAIARTELQQGMMALTRAVARPTNF